MKKHNLKCILKYWAAVLLLSTPIFSKVSFAQPILSPIGLFNEKTAPPKSSGAALRTQSMSLPFFDDFSGNDQQPDVRYWMPGSGVYINNNMTNVHPSRNIATFDGLNAKGRPYKKSDLDWGDTDTLTSQPIDLSKLTVADSVYLSFYLMPRGFGELPDSMDVFFVEFKNQLGEWELTADSVNRGGVITGNYLQKIIHLANPGYFHSNFQFRFRTMGRQSGAFDAWNLDYVYLNKNRSPQDLAINDYTTTVPFASPLSRYTAMPLKQYLLNKEKETSKVISVQIRQLGKFNAGSEHFLMQDVTNHTIIKQQTGEFNLQSNLLRDFSIAPLSITNIQKPIRIKSTYFLSVNYNSEPPPIPEERLRQNDTITVYTDLNNYYAYDDGSAEYMMQMNRLGKVAVRFIQNRPDTLAGVELAIIPSLKDLSGQAFTLQVWGNSSGKPGPLIYQQSASVSYPSTRNGFTYFPFRSGVAVPDTFYVGWLQIDASLMPIGFDKNSTLGASHIFYNIASKEWAQANLQGNLMIRPFTGGIDNNPITGVEPTPVTSLRVYPNPSQGLIRWDNEQLRQIEIYSASGVLIQTISPASGVREASLGHLPNGLYVLRLSHGKIITTQKLLLFK